MRLKNGTLLQGGKYKIVKCLGQGGFGITYLANQNTLDIKVAIKEFFMKDLCNRDESTSCVSVGSEGSRNMVERFCEKFVKEAQHIAKLSHPNIITVIDVFNENDTAYYVMEYCEGGSLSTLLNEKYPHGMPEHQTLKYIKEIASALDYIHHRNINHLDVKPGNIMLNKRNEAILIDFGLAKQYDLETGNQTSTTPVGISEGYAPMEQYSKDGVKQFSPSTDIYSLGALLYKLVTGLTPPNAFYVNENGLGDFRASNSIRTAIITAMSPRRIDRPHNVSEWLHIIDNDKDSVNLGNSINNDERIRYNELELIPQIKNDKGDEVIENVNKNKNIKKLFKRQYLHYIVGLTILLLGCFIYNNRKSTEQFTYGTEEQSLISNATGKEHGHEYVDLGLSVKWATCNVGASSPSDYGQYFAWGETKQKKRYDWDNCYDCLDNEGHSWNIHNGKIADKIRFASDAASVNWGDPWRLPTDEEFKELNDKCEWIWCSISGNNGYKITGPNGNSIFLPAGGQIDGESNEHVGGGGSYWSSIMMWNYPICAWGLYFNSTYHQVGNGHRKCGLCIRPVIR